MEDLTPFSDDELQDYLLRAVARERECSAEVVGTICEVDRRGLYKSRGYPSIFEYCTSFLGYSEDEAYKRMQAAKAAKSYPLILQRLETGDMTLTSVRLIAPHLTQDNYRSLLERAKGKSRRELELMVAHLNPQPERREVVRHLPSNILPAQSGAAAVSLDLPAEALAASKGPVSLVKPVAPDRVRFAFTGTEAFLVKVDRCRDLLRRKFPAGHLEDVFSEAIDALLRDRDPACRPKPAQRRRCARRTRRIPLWIREVVWRRDGGQCSFVASSVATGL